MLAVPESLVVLRFTLILHVCPAYVASESLLQGNSNLVAIIIIIVILLIASYFVMTANGPNADAGNLSVGRSVSLFIPFLAHFLFSYPHTIAAVISAIKAYFNNSSSL